MTKYNLTIGLNDKDTKTQKYDDITAYKLVENILKEYLNGYTILKAFGGYKHDDGTFTQENSLRVELLFTTKLQVKLICDKIKLNSTKRALPLRLLRLTHNYGKNVKSFYLTKFPFFHTEIFLQKFLQLFYKMKSLHTAKLLTFLQFLYFFL